MAALDTEKEQESKGAKRDPKEVVSRWLKELGAADTHESEWRTRADAIVKLYRDERAKATSETSTEKRYNIIYANSEVTKGALYSQAPSPDVRRRFADKDPVARYAALTLQRALVSCLDQSKDGDDFDTVMKDAVFDMVVPGRGVARVKYIPTMRSYEERVEVEPPADGAVPPKDVQQDETGYFRMQAVEEVESECVEVDYVEWTMFRYSPAKRWKKVRWVAFGDLLTRDDLVKQFGSKIGNAVEMKWMPKGTDDSEENSIFKRALVWTIWNKTQRRCIVVTEGYKDAPLKEQDDPLRLQGFFPMPRPLYSINSTDTLVPTPEYVIYQDHAMQLDSIEERIAVLTSALRRRGVRDGSIEELAELATAGDNKFIAIKKYREFVEKGGLEQAFQESDISSLALVIMELMKQADSKKQQIYEIIGISDIMRGATVASETLGAQKLKGQWGSVRVGPRQADVQRFARDLIRLEAEIIAEHFGPKALAAMTGISLFETVAEKQQAVALATQPIPGQPPAKPDPRLSSPTWEEVCAVLKNDKLRGFKVDIETDSTIKPQADDEQKNRIEGITAITGFLEKVVPAVQAGTVPKKVAMELLMFGIRSFKAGPQLEEILDEWGGDDLNGGEEQSPEVVQLKQQLAQLQPLADENAMKKEELVVRREELGAKREERQAQAGERQAQAARDQTRAAMEDKKLAAETERAAIELEDKRREREGRVAAEAQKHGKEVDATASVMQQAVNEALAGPLVQALNDMQQSQAQMLQQFSEQQTRALEEFAGAVSDAVTAEKELVRDPKSGRATGVRVKKAA